MEWVTLFRAGVAGVSGVKGVAGVLFVLAENFDGLWVWIFIPPLVLTALAGLSFIPSSRGHWSGVLLAAPAVGLGLLLFLAAAGGRAPLPTLLFSVMPAAVGFASIRLWAQKRERA